MALRPCCNVFGTAKGVKKHRLTIEVETDKADVWDIVSVRTADYCPRGLERAIGLLHRAVQPPCVRKKTSDSS